MSEYLSVARQIQILFEAIPHPEGRPYTIREVSEQIDVSLAAISQMRSGRIKNPQLNTLRELCRFFGVPLRYFDTRTPEECYAILQARDEAPPPVLNEIAYRATRLSPASQRDVLTLIQWVQAAEQQRGHDENLPPLPHLETAQDLADDE